MAVGPAPRGSRSAAGSSPNGLGALDHRARRRWPRRLLIAVNVVVVALLAIGASTFGYVQWRFGQVNRIEVAGLTPAGETVQSPAAAGSPITILVVGSDTRSLGQGTTAAFGAPQEVSGQRSDTIMLVRVVPATASIALLSVPRDLLVSVPGLGTTRINAAFGGGPNLLVQTVQQDLGVQVNHFAVFNFLTFVQVADAIGGVYQYFPAPAKDIWSNLVVPRAGCVLLDGNQALAFVRSREYEYYLDGTWQYQMSPESDLARVQRQQDFVKLALKKTEQVAPTDPIALNRVISGVTSSLTVDRGFSSSLMLDLVLDLRHANVAGIPNWTYPTVNSTAVPGALDPVPSEDQQVVSQFLAYGLPKQAAPDNVAGATVSTGPVTVRVLNGTGVPGQAARAAEGLQTHGFKVSSTGNAGNFDYAESVLQYGVGASGVANRLAAQVGGGATLQESPSLSSHELVLITGQSFSGVSAAAAAAPPATATPTSSPAPSVSTAAASLVPPSSSSFYHGRYIPPGLLAGQVPAACPS